MSSTSVDADARAAWRRHGSTASTWELRQTLAAGTLIEAATATARRHPDREAFRIGEESIDHAELDDRSRRLAGHLVANGVEVGGRVLIAGPNSVPFVVAYLAALRAGAAVSLASPALRARELAHLLQRAAPSIAVVSPDVGARLDALGEPGHGPLRLTLGAGPGSTAEAIAASAPARDPSLSSAAVAHLSFTSGTTGTPKVVPLTHANLLASVRGVITAWAWRDDDVLVHALPLQHAHGLTAVHLTLLTGSRSVVLPSFGSASLGAAIRSEAATVLFGVPAIYEQLLADGALTGADTSSLRLATSGSAPLPARTSDALTRVLGTRPLERYGLTEAGFVLSNLYAGERRADSVGYPLPGVEVELVDAQLRPVPDGTDGEVVVRGPQVFAGYLDDPDPAATWTPDGWFRTGDLANRSPVTGAISITGRIKELIITGGLNVAPREVELAIEAQPHVRAAAVVGVPSTRWGEEVTAFVEADPGFDPASMLAALRAELAAYKCPKRCVVVDVLPRNHLGKLLRAELRERATG